MSQELPNWLYAGPNLSFESNELHKNFFLAFQRYYCEVLGETVSTKESFIELLIAETLPVGSFNNIFWFCLGWAANNDTKNLFVLLNVNAPIIKLLLQKEIWLYCKDAKMSFLLEEQSFKKRFSVLFD